MAKSRITATVEGGKELEEKILGVIANVEDLLLYATQAAADVIADRSNTMAPSPDIETDTISKTRDRVEIDVGPTDDRWGWKFLETGATTHEISGNWALEFSTTDENLILRDVVHHPGMSADPFLRPAFDSEKDNAVSALGDRLKGALK